MRLPRRASGNMRRVEEYKQRAQDCRALAALTMRPDDKVILEEIAKAWDKVATLRERNLEEANFAPHRAELA